jgi:hypothetical protein
VAAHVMFSTPTPLPAPDPCISWLVNSRLYSDTPEDSRAWYEVYKRCEMEQLRERRRERERQAVSQ